MVQAFPSPSPASVRSGYDRWAQVYDHDGNPLIALEETFMHEAIGEVHGLEVLDLGCGTGRLSLWLASRGAAVTAVDFSEGMLAEARRKPGAEAVRFVAHDLAAPTPFPDGTFQRIVSGLVLEHIQDLAGFFKEIHRVLRPGGRAVLSALHPAMFLRGTAARFTDPETGLKVFPGSLPHQVGDFVMAALGAGFQVEGILEQAPTAELIAFHPKAAEFAAFPMLLILRLRA